MGQPKVNAPVLHEELLAVLGVPFPRGEAAEGEPRELDGEWIGVFGRAVLGPVIVSSYEARFAGNEGSSADKHGSATLAVVRWKNDRIVFTKTYENGEIVHHRGKLVGHTLLGYWEAPGILPRRGLFAIHRAERLDATTREAIRRSAVINRRTFFFFTLPFVALLAVLFVARHHMPSPGYLALYSLCFIVLGIMGHQVLPHNRLLERVRRAFGPREPRAKDAP